MTSTTRNEPHGRQEDTALSTRPADSPAPVGRRRALTSMLGAVLATTAACSAARSDDGVGTVEESDGGPGTSGTSSALPVEAPSAAPPTTPARDADMHVLRRLTFGPVGADVDRLRSTGLETWLAEQLAPDDLDTRAVDDELAEAFPQLEQPAAEILADYQADGNGPLLAAVLPGATLVRHTKSPAQLQERLIEFWGDHFNVPQVNPPSTIARIVMDREVFRPHALGRFDDLLVATARSPAMLLYLDNFRSTAGSINENYARELLELHTVGVDGGYDEDDIVNVARLLTGWGFTRDLEFRFFGPNHDDGPVSVLGWDRPTAGDPVDHGVDFLRYLARLPETARHVSRKLATRFVSDDPADELVEAMATAWVDNDTDVTSVIRTMVSHPAFVDAPPKFNRPWDYLVQTFRSLDVHVDLTARRDLRTVFGMVTDLGQTPFRWSSPDGYPDVESAWLNAGSLLARWNLTTQLTASDGRSFPTNLTSRNVELSGRPAAEVYDGLSELLRHEPVTDEQRVFLAELTGWAPDDEPTDDELDEVTPHIAFVLLAGPPTLYR